MLAKFSYANLASKFSTANLLNSGVLLYLIWSDISFLTAAVVATKLIILRILPLTPFILALRPELVATLLILGISFLTSFILTLRVILVAKLVISGILSSICFIWALYTSFLTTSFFTTWFSLLNSRGRVFQHLIYLLYFSNGLNYLVHFFNLSISNLSTLDFKLSKSNFLPNFDVSRLFFKSAFVA